MLGFLSCSTFSPSGRPGGGNLPREPPCGSQARNTQQRLIAIRRPGYLGRVWTADCFLRWFRDLWQGRCQIGAPPWIILTLQLALCWATSCSKRHSSSSPTYLGPSDCDGEQSVCISPYFCQRCIADICGSLSFILLQCLAVRVISPVLCVGLRYSSNLEAASRAVRKLVEISCLCNRTLVSW